MRHSWIFLLLVLITIKVIVLVAAGPAAIIHDARDAWDLGTVVANGDPFLLSQDVASNTPLYAWLLALVQLTPSPLLALAILQAAMYVATVWMAASVAARVSRQKVARTITLVLMLPAIAAVMFVGAAVPDTFFACLLMLNLITVLDYAKYQTNTRAVWVGFTLGLVICLEPKMLWFCLAHLIFVLMIHYRRKFRQGNHIPVTLHHRAGHAGLAAAVVLVTMLPWVVRNTYVYKQPFLTKSIGRSIWETTFHESRGARLPLPNTNPGLKLQNLCGDSIDWESDQWRSPPTIATTLSAAELNDAEVDGLMKAVALDAIHRDPPTVLMHSGLRSLQFAIVPSTHAYSPRPNFRGFKDYPPTWSINIPVVTTIANRLYEYRFSQSWWTSAALLIVTVAGCVFLIVDWSSRPFGLWISAMLIYLAIVTGALQVPEYRLRIVIEPIIALTIGSVLAMKWAQRTGDEPDLDLELEVAQVPLR